MAVHLLVLFGHGIRRKSPLGVSPAGGPVDLAEPAHGFHELILGVANKPGRPGPNDFRDAAAA